MPSICYDKLLGGVVRHTGPLFIFEDGTPMLRDSFVKEVKWAPKAVGVDETAYSRHSFHIGLLHL